MRQQVAAAPSPSLFRSFSSNFMLLAKNVDSEVWVVILMVISPVE
jgi:hypothetical protein